MRSNVEPFVLVGILSILCGFFTRRYPLPALALGGAAVTLVLLEYVKNRRRR